MASEADIFQIKKDVYDEIASVFKVNSESNFILFGKIEALCLNTDVRVRSFILNTMFTVVIFGV